jgi:hypothetical protein
LARAAETGENRAMGRVIASLVFVAALATPAAADVFKLYAEAHGGGMVGRGTSGDQKDAAFFAKSPHGAYGALIGAEVLFFDGWIQHHQYTNGSRLTTWTQFGMGVHTVVDMGDQKEREAHTGSFLEFGAGAFFGIGTGQQVNPPLDNSQLTDKAFTMEGRLGFGTHLNKIFDLALAVPVSYGYFFKTGNGATANNLSTHYRSVQAEGLIVLRANVHLL